jgi:hypothetical protein
MISWVKRNKLASLLLLIIAYFLFKQYFGVRLLSQGSLSGLNEADLGYGSLKSAPSSTGGISMPLPAREAAPTTETDRMVVLESSLSLVVKDVREVNDKVIDQAKNLGGYMVSSSLSQPQEAPYAYIVLRVPVESLKSAIEYFRSLSIKVSSENLMGTDVTDEYVDLNARLVTLNKTKVKFEEILKKAEKVADILEVQRQIIYIQDQIDSLKGRQQYLEKTAELAKISLHLSTDEFSLPYAPTDSFRPAVIFKQAVRSLVKTARGAAKLGIWLGVYGVILIPVWFLVRLLKKKFKKSSK